jgi:hypothetical protein
MRLKTLTNCSQPLGLCMKWPQVLRTCRKISSYNSFSLPLHYLVYNSDHNSNENETHIDDAIT